MRGARRTVGVVVGLVVAAGALAGAGAAAATPAFQPAGTALAAASSGEHVFSVSSNIKFRCNQARWTGTTANPLGDTVSITAKYGTATGVAGAWCRYYVGGVFSATTVTPSAAWAMTATTYNPLTGVSSGTITTSGGTTFTTGTCVTTLTSGNVLPFQANDDTWSPAGPGLWLTINATGLHYTSSGCSGFGIPATGTTMSASGVSYDPNVYVG